MVTERFYVNACEPAAYDQQELDRRWRASLGDFWAPYLEAAALMSEGRDSMDMPAATRPTLWERVFG